MIHIHSFIFCTVYFIKVVLFVFCQFLFPTFASFFSSQIIRLYRKKWSCSPPGEQAMSLNHLFIKRDRKKAPEEPKFSQTSPHCHVRQSVCPPCVEVYWVLGPCLWSQGWRRLGPSHAAILLSGLVRHRGVRGVKGRSQCAEEASQQREAQPAPRAEHGPAVAVTDVLWYSKHVAGIAGQFKVDPGHACAERYDTACPWWRAKELKHKNASRP